MSNDEFDLESDDPTEVVFDLGDREPLSDRIIAGMDDALPFSMKELQASFPTEEYWPLYRALQKLDANGQVIYYKTIGKKKYYRKANINSLPHVRGNDGKLFPISFFPLKISSLYDSERKVWRQLDEKMANKVPLLLGQLFVIAQIENIPDTELKKQWVLVRNELMDARGALMRAVDWIDAVTDHESMTGNLDKFKSVFNGKDSLTTEQIHTFLRFVNNSQREADNAD